MTKVIAEVSPTASVDGVVTSLNDAKVPLLDRGFLYGDSVYEVFRTYDGVPLFWREHFDRLENSASLIHMPIKQTREQMLADIREAVSTARKGFEATEAVVNNVGDEGAVGRGEVYVRFHLSRGVGPIDLFPDPELATSFMVIVKPVPSWKAEHYEVGLRLAVTEVRRNADNAMSPNIKSGNYLNNILGLAEAVRLGADDCLMLNAAGELTESSNSNVFFVIDGKVKTACQESGILRGITGDALRIIGKQKGWPIEDTTLKVEDISRATEAFVTSATREVMPVASIRLPSGEQKEFPAGGGELTRQAADDYRIYVEEYTEANKTAKLW